MSGAGSYSTGTFSTWPGSMPLTSSRASNSVSLPPAWTPIFLPIRSCGVAMFPPSASDRMVNGFFWNLVPTILSGASSSAMTWAVETALLSPKSASPLATRVSMGPGPGSIVTEENPASA